MTAPEDKLKIERLEKAILVFYRQHSCAKEKGAVKCAVCSMIGVMVDNGFVIEGEAKKPETVYCSKGCGRVATVKIGMGVAAKVICSTCWSPEED